MIQPSYRPDSNNNIIIITGLIFAVREIGVPWHNGGPIKGPGISNYYQKIIEHLKNDSAVIYGRFQGGRKLVPMMPSFFFGSAHTDRLIVSSEIILFNFIRQWKQFTQKSYLKFSVCKFEINYYAIFKFKVMLT